MRRGLASSLFAALAVAILLTAWLKPTWGASPVEGFAVVFIVQVAAFGLSRYIAPNRGGSVVKAVVSSALFAFIVILVMKPSVAVSFDELFLLVTIIEFAALVVAQFLTGGKRASGE